MEKLFAFGKPVDERFFTDREVEASRLEANFKGGVNTFILSPRRWGKTSLVNKVIKATESKKLICVSLDIFKTKTPAEFCDAFGNAVLAQTSSAFEEFVDSAKKFMSRIHIGMELSPDLATPMKIQFHLDKDSQSMDDILNLPQKIASEKKIDIVVCLDEFQQIADYEDALTFQKQLRTIWQQQDRVSYCLYGSKKHMMEGLFDDESKPFYKFGDIMYLKRIPFEYWNCFISDKFQSAGKKISEEQIKTICRTVEFHSSYVQQLCWYVYLSSGEKVEDEDITEGTAELIAQNSALFESRTENLTPAQMRFLCAVADGVNDNYSSAAIIDKYQLGSSAASVAIRKALIEKGLLFMEEGSAFLSDPVLGLWLKLP